MCDQEKCEATARIKMQRVEQYQKLTCALMSPKLRLSIDLSFLHHQNAKECNSLMKQLSYAFGYIKACPLDTLASLALCSYDEKMSILCQKHGILRWRIPIHTEAVDTICNLNDIIYLSPDAELVLETLDFSKVYVIGAIVDRTVRKNESSGRAEKLQCRSARLPVREYLPQARTHVLNVDSVIIALNEYMNHSDWHRAFKVAVPKRIQHRK